MEDREICRHGHQAHCCRSCRKEEESAVAFSDGVISPDQLKMGIFALMCLVKTILRQHADGKGVINIPDMDSLKDCHAKLDQVLREMGL